MELSWKYNTRRTPGAPVIRLEVAGVPVESVVDTGFAGSLLIPFPLFQSLGLLTKLTPNKYHAVMPDSRRILLYTAQEEVKIGSLKMYAEVHSCHAVDRKLLGRTLLRSFVATLDGRNEMITLSQD